MAARSTRAAGTRRRSDAIERACRERGLRMTGQRRTIARILDDAEDHPDVVELHRRAAAVDDRISLSTVYRTVKLLETEGIIERLDFRDGRSRYEQAAREHHDHLINLETGAVIEFHSEEIEALQTEIARRLGYKVVYHRLELYAVPLNSKTPSRDEDALVRRDGNPSSRDADAPVPLDGPADAGEPKDRA